MRISMRADYGARAMLDLAQRFGNGLAQTAEIAARQQIPESYLEQLLTTVRKAGLIRTVVPCPTRASYRMSGASSWRATGARCTALRSRTCSNEAWNASHVACTTFKMANWVLLPGPRGVS